jgi:serine phosphatase RsbU (regulator of sigma subunit)
LATVGQTADQRRAGLRTLHWTNAGHLPSVLIEPDGSSQLLTTEPDLLIGLDPAADRTDHAVPLRPGSTVVLYTDGLVERRGASIDDGLDWLLTATSSLAHVTPDQLCDLLLDAVADTAEDDVALLVMRAHPEDRRP